MLQRCHATVHHAIPSRIIKDGRASILKFWQFDLRPLLKCALNRIAYVFDQNGQGYQDGDPYDECDVVDVRWLKLRTKVGHGNAGKGSGSCTLDFDEPPWNRGEIGDNA